MLGRVFESLMAAERRRGSGTYFTPRSLLRGTVERALGAALRGADAGTLRGARVLDPAVGSGAFLLESLRWLEQRRAVVCPGETPAARRRSILRDNLFGVDLDPMAVRLAELRLWLALVADDDVAWDQVAPLPNLDGNLRQGDSLLSPLDHGAARAPDAVPHVRAVAEARAAYFTATGRDKAALARRIRSREREIALAGARAEIASLTARLADAAAGRDLFGRRARRSAVQERAIRTWRARRRELRSLCRHVAGDDRLPFFAYDVHFGDVLAAGGFDVVLGNPPWVRGERIPPAVRERLAARYASFRAVPGARGFAHLPDLAVAFVERALELARESGVVVFLLPAKLLRAGYAGPLRALVRRRASVLAIDDRSHGEHEFAATVFPMVLALRREAPVPDATVAVRLVAPGGTLEGEGTQADLALDPDAPRSPWLALPAAAVTALRAVLAAGPPLRSRFRPRLGVKTGANDVFVREASAAGELPSACRVPAILGRDITPFRVAPSCVVLAALDRAGRPLRTVPDEVAGYLAPHRAALARRADAGTAAPWALFRTDLVGPRWLVLWRDIADALQAAVLERAAANDPIPLNTCYGVSVQDEFTALWLCAWLNSPLIGAAALALAERASGGAYRLSAATVGALPTPGCTGHPALPRLAHVAAEATRGRPWSPDDLDALVADALGLAPRQAAALAGLGATLRRSPGRDR